MPRAYTVQFEDVTVSAAQDLFSFDAASDKPIELVALELAQNTELGDAAEEQLRLKVLRGATSVGSGGTAPTPVPTSPGDTAAGFTARVNDTTQAGTGTIVTALSTAFNVRVGYSWGPVPYGMGIWTSGTALLVVSLVGAPADALDMSGTATVIEYP